MRSRSRGFLLAEAAFSVIVMVLVVTMLQNLLGSIRKANKVEHRTDSVVYAYVQFERFLHTDETKTIYTLPNSSNAKASFVKIEREGKKDVKTNYIIQRYKNMIRVTTDNGGHMPLLLNVSQAEFFTKAEEIKILVTEVDGRKSELLFKFDKQPKVKDYKKAKRSKNKVINDES